jgi:hypothetical protein
MIHERIKKRLKQDRPMTSITLRVPADVVDDLKVMAPELGFAGYQPLIRAYISEGMRRDEKKLYFTPVQRMAEALKARGIDPAVIQEALTEIDAVQSSRKPAPPQHAEGQSLATRT